MIEPAASAATPYRYEVCGGACPHRKLYVDPDVTVWTCPVERRIWTDPMRGLGTKFRITFSYDVIGGSRFEWLS